MKYPDPGLYIRDDGMIFSLLFVAKDITTGLPAAVFRSAEDENAPVLTCPLRAWRGYSPLPDEPRIPVAPYDECPPPAECPPPSYGEYAEENAPRAVSASDRNSFPGGNSAPDGKNAPGGKNAPDGNIASAVNSLSGGESAVIRDKYEVLREYFGYDEFRDGQETLIDSIISGRDTVGVMPTGAGKSICYQVPALMLPGCAIVISPLISLMKDQVAALRQAGVPAAYLNSSLTARQMELALENALAGAYKIIYVAPERLETRRFQNIARRLNISLIAVDEAHCISQWGQDFRPSYLAIPDFIDTLPVRPRICAFTATATVRVREDIVRVMRLKREFMCVTGFDRPNLYYRVLRPSDKMTTLMAMIKEYEGKSGIVYCATRKDVERVWGDMLMENISVTRYHAGLSDEERRRNQEDFTTDRARIMVATNAFGMGIDKSDVRFVIHFSMPGDLESYYQEAGRAGRDGDSAECTLLYGRQDIFTQRFFIDHMGEESDISGEELKKVQAAARKRLSAMIDYCETTGCLRAFVLNYFGEDSMGRCGSCSVCAGEERDPYEEFDITKQIDVPRKKRREYIPAREDSPMDAPLFERLRALRQKLSAARGVPAYVVFTDATLRNMSMLKPRTSDEFLKVSGVVIAKQREYGRDFIREIEKYLREQE